MFAFHSVQRTPPDGRRGKDERYLGSGLVKGIGSLLAKKLVGRFGAAK
jgi:hypothetical protein